MKGCEEAHGKLQHEKRAGHDERLPPESSEPMTLSPVVLLDMEGLVFADIVPTCGNRATVRLIVVGAEKPDFPVFQSLEQAV